MQVTPQKQFTPAVPATQAEIDVVLTQILGDPNGPWTAVQVNNEITAQGPTSLFARAVWTAMALGQWEPPTQRLAGCGNMGTIQRESPGAANMPWPKYNSGV